MKKFRMQLQAVLEKLGLTAKAKDRTLTADDWKAIEDSYKETYGTDLSADYAAARAAVISDAERDSLLAIINSALPEGQEPTSDLRQAIESLTASNQQLKAQIAAMVLTATPDVAPVATRPATLPFMGPGTTATHLFGIESDLFSMSHRYNKVSAQPSLILQADPSDADQKDFFAGLKAFGAKIADRYRELSADGRLVPDRLAVGAFAIDTEGFDGMGAEGLGERYVVRRVDALIARLLTYRSVTDLFPVRYGIQDREAVTNAFFTTVSQAWQRGNVFKGSMELKPEIGYVDDAMVKVEFGTMEEIERTYLGYLNREGSDAMKWSMIEFALINLYQVMLNEQNRRRILGFYMKPVTGKPGHYLNAGSGVIYTLLRLYFQNTIKPHWLDGPYDDETMYDVVSAFISDVRESLDADQDLTGKCIYLNANHRPWWLKNIRTIFGKDTDFSGPDSYANVVPDQDIPIKWVPNMGQLQIMFIQEPGNIQLLENRPGEMFNIGIDVEMEQVRVWSRWKEGCSPAFAGKSFGSYDALEENDYKMQQIFLGLSVGSAEDLLAGEVVIVGDDIGDDGIASLAEELPAGRLVVFTEGAISYDEGHVGSIVMLCGPWAKESDGDYLMLAKNEDGILVELERREDGVRSIVSAVQPNIPGAEINSISWTDPEHIQV